MIGGTCREIYCSGLFQEQEEISRETRLRTSNDKQAANQMSHSGFASKAKAEEDAVASLKAPNYRRPISGLCTLTNQDYLARESIVHLLLYDFAVENLTVFVL